MLAISPRLTVLALIPMLGLPLVMMSLGQLIHRRSQAIQAQFSDLTTQAHENLSGVRVVRAYRQERAEIAQFRELSEVYLGTNLELARVQGLFFPLLTLLGGLSAVVVLYVGGGLVIAGHGDGRRVRGLRGVPRDAGLADDRARLGSESGPAWRGLDGPDQPALPRARRDRRAGRAARPAPARPGREVAFERCGSAIRARPTGAGRCRT